MEYKTTIGLEIHAELKTKTKMFCRCLNQSVLEAKPNSNICPICVGHPGTLPTINKEAVRSVLKVGVALNSNLADFTEFDRKNYFYPDIPKGYQISQYKFPLVSGGSLNDIQITRIHLEEDTARSTHDEGSESDEFSLVDFNRAGVPLMELVTEPVIYSAKDASDFAKELQLLLRTLGVSDAEMSRGEMRVEANVSVSNDPNKLGTKVEIKNLNSFSTLEKSIEYEIKRQISELQKGNVIVQETRGSVLGKIGNYGTDPTSHTWGTTVQTFSQRQKEDSHDYRYFPDPDLPKLKLSLIPEFSKENLVASLPELPNVKRERYLSVFKLSPQHVEFFVSDPKASKYFDEIATNLNEEEILLASNYVAVDLVSLAEKEKFKSFPEPKDFASLIKMIKKGELSSRGAKDVLAIMVVEGGTPEKIAKEKNLIQKNDSGELEQMLKKIISENPSVVADYKAGKESALMFFVGQVMKESKGSANPTLAKEIAQKLLKF